MCWIDRSALSAAFVVAWAGSGWVPASTARAQSFTTELFPGVTHTQRLDTSFRRVIINVIEARLDHPGVRFLMTPSNGPAPLETNLQNTLSFLNEQNAQAAVNAHFFSPLGSPGTPADVIGLAASGGDVYSPYANGFPAFTISTSNKMSFFDDAEFAQFGLPPAVDHAGAGSDVLVRNGANVAPPGSSGFNGPNPRTAIGVNSDGTVFILMTVDGRRSGVSEGVSLVELAQLMQQYGARQALNLDGGGSTTMAVAAPSPRVVNLPSDGGLRANGSNLAVLAQAPTPVLNNASFAQNQGGYAGTVDKAVRALGGDTDNADSPTIRVDATEPGPAIQPSHGLLRFDGIIGDDAVPPFAEVLAATLTVRVVDPGSGFTLHRMTEPWTASTGWVDLGGDGITPGIEADATPIASVGQDAFGQFVPTGALELDVRSAVQAWADGTPNHGFGFVNLPNGSDGVGFSSSDGATPPRLEITYAAPGGGVAVFDAATDTMLRQAQPTTSFAAADPLRADTIDDGGASEVLLRFDGLFGAGINAVPEGARIESATLDLTGEETGADADVYRLLVPWSPGVTWAGGFGGNGVDPNGVEAWVLPETTADGAIGADALDVTQTLRLWSGDPASAQGWAILSTGSDGWAFASAEDAVATRRPTLTVVFANEPCAADVTRPFDGVPDAADVQAFVTGLPIGFSDGTLAAPADVGDWFDAAAFLDALAQGCGG